MQKIYRVIGNPLYNMANYRGKKSFGERQEYIVIAELLKGGYDVYKTLVDDQGIDCVIRKDMSNGPRYIDLQIKALSKKTKKQNAGLFAALEISNPRENYLFVFYSEWLDAKWIIPSLYQVEKASRNKKGKNVGKYT
ncbi:MAG: hypothetical protein ACP5UZ_09045, partial [Thermoplasmata archaeon]